MCGSPRRARLAGARAPLVRCRGCGLVHRDPPPAREELEAHYRGAYYDDQERFGAAGIVAARLPVYRDLLARWRRAGRGGRLLDVGAGYGDFVRLAAEAGFAARGVEPSPRACAVARERLGLAVHEGTLESAPLEEGSFDVVTLWNVLDQVADPRAELARVRRLLRPGGTVAVRVPNAAFHRLAHAAWRRAAPLLGRLGARDPSLFMPWNYDARTLRRLLEAEGFAGVRVGPSPLTAGDPYGSLGRAAALARPLKLAAAALGRLPALVRREWLLVPSLYGEGTRPSPAAGAEGTRPPPAGEPT